MEGLKVLNDEQGNKFIEINQSARINRWESFLGDPH